jgi:hypothetical protein
MEPKQIIDLLIDGTNPVTNVKFDNGSPWVRVSVIRALCNVLRAVEAEQIADMSTCHNDSAPPSSIASALDKMPSPASKKTGMPEPDLGNLRLMLLEGTNTKLCCHCHVNVSGNYLTLTGTEPMFVFCDDDCFNEEVRNLSYLCGWIRVFESSTEDNISECSVCSARIFREKEHFTNFVVTNKGFTNPQEVAILCEECESKFEERWFSQEL